jgi:hypothetical protein
MGFGRYIRITGRADRGPVDFSLNHFQLHQPPKDPALTHCHWLYFVMHESLLIGQRNGSLKWIERHQPVKGPSPVAYRVCLLSLPGTDETAAGTRTHLVDAASDGMSDGPLQSFATGISSHGPLHCQLIPADGLGEVQRHGAVEGLTGLIAGEYDPKTGTTGTTAQTRVHDNPSEKR